MRTLTQIREKHEQNKRNCLLKKIKFYEYLISYGGPHNSFLPAEETKSKTSSLFFPNIQPSQEETLQSTSESAKMTSLVVEIDDFAQNKTISTIKEPKMQKIRMREAFRPSRREDTWNVSELTAKSMTPSIRINKPISSRERKHSTNKHASLFIKENSISVTPRNFSPKRTTFLGDLSYVKEAKRPQKIEIPKRRKVSICPWDVDQSPL